MGVITQEELIRDHINKSPVLHLRSLKVVKKKPEFYSDDELRAFFAQEMQSAYRYFFLTLLYSGMRFGEASNLRWTDIDFDKRLVFVRPKPDHRLKTPKSERAIPMNKVLFGLLSDLNKCKTSELVFVTDAGSQIKQTKALTICKIVGQKAGITSRVFQHKFRPTFATTLVRKGVTLESIKELLGHASLVETEKSYANNEANHLHSDVKVLDNLLDEIHK